MGIDGLSEATIEKFIAKGFIKEYADIYRIERYRDEIVDMEGFGEKSYRNLVNSINKSRKTNAVRLLYGLGISNVGLSNAKLICRHFSYDWNRIENASFEELISIKGIGEVMAGEYVKFFSNERNRRIINNLLQELEFEKIDVSGEDQIFKDITFVITGEVYNYKNRSELKKVIEEKGGKVTDSVTSNTDYLINNDILSNSAKNKKAKELGIKIIDEAAFIEWLNGGTRP